MSHQFQPIGVFDSGYGGLTILKEFINVIPEYDFIYLGDNARAPYGSRSFEVVYEYTLQAVTKLFEMGCPLVILACNTASAKALRNIQMNDLPQMDPNLRVLGVIRPAVEAIGDFTRNGHVGILGTTGTVLSNSYPIELEKWANGKVVKTTQEACPIWVPLVENNEIDSPGTEYFVSKNINNLLLADPEIDSIILGCTHYPLLLPVIQKFVPEDIQLLEQGKVVSSKLVEYLSRHPEMDQRCSKSGIVKYYTTENVEIFEKNAATFIGQRVKCEKVILK
ncbi:glutamate racemase [Aquipluma nitroreducens]|uniref:Glutamate racemase n=1 Tax=Aquipluma nitroreducens TaxID=2010828 RepID=A0A5K7SED1_9BACT|nr:glutamate racemase [Aquipluma nitroreducens]BBE19928.1 glutamate racemase [Aquipluma nitroreducens]